MGPGEILPGVDGVPAEIDVGGFLPGDDPPGGVILVEGVLTVDPGETGGLPPGVAIPGTGFRVGGLLVTGGLLPGVLPGVAAVGPVRPGVTPCPVCGVAPMDVGGLTVEIRVPPAWGTFVGLAVGAVREVWALDVGR